MNAKTEALAQGAVDGHSALIDLPQAKSLALPYTFAAPRIHLLQVTCLVTTQE
jgi:hypothetical protein